MNIITENRDKLQVMKDSPNNIDITELKSSMDIIGEKMIGYDGVEWEKTEINNIRRDWDRANSKDQIYYRNVITRILKCVKVAQENSRYNA